MADERHPKSSIPLWVVHICTWFWSQYSFVWGTLILGVLIGIFTSWLFSDPSTFSKLPIYWFYLHRFYIMMAFVILVLLFALSYVVSQIYPSKSESHNSLENYNFGEHFVKRRGVTSFDTSFYYRLTNNFLGSGKSLDVKSDESRHLMMAPTGNYSGQLWKLTDVGGGKYALRTAFLGENFSLDVINDDTNNMLRMAPSGNFSGQIWALEPWGDGTYKLTNDFTGHEKSLDTYSDTYQPFLGDGNHSGQHWTLTQLTRIPI